MHYVVFAALVYINSIIDDILVDLDVVTLSRSDKDKLIFFWYVC